MLDETTRPQSALEDHAQTVQEPAYDAGPKYWASEVGPALLSALGDRERRFFDYCQRRGYFGMWRMASEEFYGSSALAGGFDAQSVSFDGQEAELIRFRVAELRSHIRQVVAMNTKDRPAFKGTPTNTDYDSLAEITSAETGIEYVYKSAHGERKEREACELCEVFAGAYTWIQWDPNGGQELLVPGPALTDPMTGAQVPGPMQTKMSGVITTDVMLPWDQFCDPLQRDQTKHAWRTMRQRVSKWRAAAKYPKYAAFLKSMTYQDDWLMALQLSWVERNSFANDDILLKHFYHARTPELPEGRYVVYCGTQIIYDSSVPEPEMAEPARTGLPYSRVPVVALQSSSLIGSAMGYSDSWDLVVLQQMLTQSTSDMATAITTYGHPAMSITKGTDIDENAYVNGTFLLTTPIGADPPKYLQPPSIPEAQFKWIGTLLQFFREISGLNAVVRGDTSSEIKSGQHAALYHAIAQEFQTERLAALALYREEVANLMLDILKRFAQHPFFAEIAGTDERNHIQAFTREKFMGIRRVTLEATKPTSMQQNLEMLQLFQEMGLLKTPEQVAEVVHTGRLKSALESTNSKMRRVRWENEQIMLGKVTVQQVPKTDPLTGQPMIGPDGLPVMDQITPEIPVLPTDDPFIHVPEVLSLLDSPEAIHNPAILDVVTAHVLWHMRIYAEMTPDVCQVLHIPPPSSGMAQLQNMTGADQLAPAAGGLKEPPSEPKGNAEQVGQKNFPTPTPAQSPTQGATT